MRGFRGARDERRKSETRPLQAARHFCREAFPDARRNHRRRDRHIVAGQPEQRRVGNLTYLRFREPGGEPSPFQI